MSEQQLAEYREIAGRAVARPLFFSDCEGVLKIWALSALTHVTRNEAGEITGWSEPGSHTACDLVAEVELDMGTWDPGEDMDDDQRREDMSDLVAAREAVGVLLAEADRLRDERDAFADRVDTLTAEIVAWLDKKAIEYRSTGSRQHAFQADAIELMASKIARGAVRPGGGR